MGSEEVNGTAKQPWIMNAFAMTAPGHLSPGECHQRRYLLSKITNPVLGLWRHPDQEKQDLNHWVEVAKMLDEAKFHGLVRYTHMHYLVGSKSNQSFLSNVY